MSKILSLALRPRSLSAMYGQESVVAAIRKQMATRQPQTWMFYGPSGTGKTTAAGILAVAFQCSHMELWGDPCEACWKRRPEFLIHEINASDNTGVQDVRKWIDLGRYAPLGGGKRIIILNECQRLSPNAQEALLDPTEKPAKHLIWIFCTTEPQKILPTLRNRCIRYQTKTLGFSAAEDFLKKQAARAKVAQSVGPLVEQCHLMQVAAPRDLLMALEKYAAGMTAAESVMGADSDIDSLRVCKAVTSGQWKTVAENLLQATPEQARWIRASVAGWIKGILVKELSSVGLDRASVSILELCNPPLDDATMIHWLWATLYKITKRYKEGNR